MVAIMVKKNLKKVAYILVTLFLIGLTGFSIALYEFNGRYEHKHREVQLLSGQLVQLEERINTNRQKLANYDFMAYKTNAFSQRYPVFSQILNSVYDKSAQYGFSPDLVLGVIKVESNFNPKAVSYMGAYGLMQINLSVWRKELKIDQTRIMEVDYNIDLGLQILKRYYIESNGNLKRALHLYNNGYLYNNTKYPGQVDSAVKTITANRTNWQSLGY
jgi:soluble lytic murein transglycosylase-like protein